MSFKLINQRDYIILFGAAGLIALQILITHFLSVNIIILALYLSLFFFISVKLQPALFWVNFFGLISAGLPCSLVATMYRLQWIGLGLCVVVIFRLIIFPPTLSNERKHDLLVFFKQLDRLQRIIFHIYLQRDYKFQWFFYEKKIHQYLAELFQQVNLLRKLSQQINWQCENLLAYFISLGNLRYRIKDYATFEVCEIELKKISNALSRALKSIKKPGPELREAIDQFKQIYDNTLTVITNDPIDFLIFIDNLQRIEFSVSKYED